MGLPFDGAKVALFLGTRLVVILRDCHAGLPYPGHWDLPGGGREGHESPFECVARECFEELGLVLERGMITARRHYPVGGGKWFFVARMDRAAADAIRFGDEGQCWKMMTATEYCTHPKGIDILQDRLKSVLYIKPPAA